MKSTQLKKLFLFVFLLILLFGIAVIFKNYSLASEWLVSLSKEGTFLFPSIVIAALVDSINPCAFSVLLLTVGFLFTMGKSQKDILRVGGMFILGIFTVYVLIGVGLLQALQIFGIPYFMAKVGAMIMILAGLINLINEVFPSFPIKLKIPTGAHHRMAVLIEKASIPTALILGLVVGMYEFPCTGGPYLVVLGLLHDNSTFFTGFKYLVLYNLIFILPLLLILFIASNKGLLEKVQAWQQTEKNLMRWVGGFAMILLGVLIILFS